MREGKLDERNPIVQKEIELLKAEGMAAARDILIREWPYVHVLTLALLKKGSLNRAELESLQKFSYSKQYLDLLKEGGALDVGQKFDYKLFPVPKEISCDIINGKLLLGDPSQIGKELGLF